VRKDKEEYWMRDKESHTIQRSPKKRKKRKEGERGVRS